ncbi:MAG: hypothetical protein AAF671_06235, partial [Pseudomonadota bacterium]
LKGILIAAALNASAAAEMPPAGDADIVWIASGEFCEPETVLPLPDESLLISNVCGFSTMGSGFLSLLSAGGDVLNWRIVDKLDSPLGMALLGERIYVVDANRVRIFSWPEFLQLDLLELPTRVANDIAVAKDGTIYVSDSAEHTVIQLSGGGASRVAESFEFTNANGLELYEDNLYVGGKRLWRVDPRRETVTTIGPKWLMDIDGIEFEGDGTMQLTPVGGPLIRYLGDGDLRVYSGEGISSTNHGFLSSQGLALIPTGYANTVIAVRVESLD